MRRVVFLSCICLLATILNTTASADDDNFGVVEANARLKIFAQFHPIAYYNDAAYNPGCDKKRMFPQMIRIPQFENAWHIVHSCKKYESNDVSQAMLVFYTRWKAEFGDPNGEVWKELNSMLIEWSPEKKVISSAYTLDGKKLEKPRIIGLCLTAGWIWVYTSKEPMHRTIGNTSFIHELVHASLWASPPHYKPDVDHEGVNYSGWTKKHSSFIVDTNFKLINMGL